MKQTSGGPRSDTGTGSRDREVEVEVGVKVLASATETRLPPPRVVALSSFLFLPSTRATFEHSSLPPHLPAAPLLLILVVIDFLPLPLLSPAARRGLE